MCTFHLFNFGCRASQADGAALKRQLMQAGFQEVAGADRSGVLVLNTCTVTAAADAEVRQVIRRLRRANPECRIVVTGCYAQRAPEEIAQLPGVVWVLGNSHKHLLVDVLRDALGVGEGLSTSVAPCSATPHEACDVPVSLVPIQVQAAAAPPGRKSEPTAAHLRAPILVGEISDEFHFAPVFPDEHTRPTLKVQDGCSACCSFCIIPQVRGASRSLAPEKVIEQVRELEAGGYREIVLSGINLGSYGKDLGRRIGFLGLLERILTETSVARVRISSIEPMDVSPGLIRLVAEEPRLAPHFHVPLQSGCDRILRLMNRRYWASQYAERILTIHEQVPNCGIGADVMVGFPGETDQDHAASARFIASLPLTYLHIFPYSARPGTRAATSPYQVNGRIARERAQELRTLINAKRQAFLQAQVGRALAVVTLAETRDGARVALSGNYLKVFLPGTALAANSILNARIVRSAHDDLIGYPDA